jgi:hypothetical protein
MASSKQKDGVLIHTRYLNGKVLYPYCALAGAVRMDSKNFDPGLGTPLYDQAVVLLVTVLAKARQFAQAGVPARTVTLLLTDGADEGSQNSKARYVAALVEIRRAFAVFSQSALRASQSAGNFAKLSGGGFGAP